MPSSNADRAKKPCWFAQHRTGAWYTLFTLVIVAVVCGGVAAVANYALTDPFAASDAALDEAKGGAQRALLFPDAGGFSQVSAPAVDGLNSVWQADTGEYVFDCSAEGYHGDVELMVGITSDGKVAGIQVVAEDETDGIGTNALTDDFFGAFADLAATGTLTVDEAGSGETHVDGVSGATFTSKAVIGCLNIAFEAYAQLGGN